MTKIHTLHAPKTSGNTIITLNTAIMHKLANPNKAVALLQLTTYPDLAQYTGTKKTKTIADLTPFIKTKEWGTPLLQKIKTTQAVDLYFSPDTKSYENFQEKDLNKILELLSETYDQIYIDLNHSIPKNLFQKILKISNQITLTTLIDPASMEALKIFWEHNKTLQKKTKILFNQCPKSAEQKIKKTIKNHKTAFIGSLPTEQDYLWQQIYEGYPLALQKKSKFRKALINIKSHTQSN